MVIIHGRNLSTDELVSEVANALAENPGGVLVYPEGVDEEELELYVGTALLTKLGRIRGGRSALPDAEAIATVPDEAVLYILPTRPRN